MSKKHAIAIIAGLAVGFFGQAFLSLHVFAPTQDVEAETIRISPSDQPAILMDEVVYKNLIHLYQTQRSEIPLCLHGRSVGHDSTLIDGVSFPRITKSADMGTVLNTGRCMDGRYVGVIHNHPKPQAICRPSPTDIKSFHNDVLATVSVVACRSPFDDHVWLYGRSKW